MARKRRKRPHKFVPIPHVLVDPEPRKPDPPPRPRKVIIKRHDDPWTGEELDRLIEQAIRYIQQAQVKWGTRLGLTVGEWLYKNLFLEDDVYMRSQSPLKTRSLYDIARQTPYKPRTLRTWAWAGRMKVRLERAGFTSERLTLTDWSALYELRDMPDAALQVARWVHEENPPVELVWDYVERWKEQKRRKKPGPPPKPEPPGPTPHKRRKRPDEMRQIRVLRLVHRWVKETDLTPRARTLLLDKIGELRSILQQGGR